MALKVMVNRLKEFERRVGVMRGLDLWRLSKLLDEPLEPISGMAGVFYEDELEGLQKFVRESKDHHSENYHIVSLLGGGRVVVNHYIPDASTWFLADGDDDPDLVSLTTLAESDRNWDAFLDFLAKFWKKKAAPQI